MKTTIIKKPGHPLLHLILGAAGLLSLLLLLVLCAVSRRISSPLLHQQGGERWQGTGDLAYEQVSVFHSVAESMDASAIEACGTTIEDKLNEAGIPNASYLVCYGGEESASVISENGRSNALVTLVGGDFFQIHGFEFLAGAGFQPDDVMQDRIVLDELAAWQLFSSNNCVGMAVTIQGETYYVAGVVAQETDRCSAECYGEKPRIYASYEQWNRTSRLSGGSLTPVTFCEAVLPEPVDDFAVSTFQSAIGVNEDEIRNNTERYDLLPLWENLQSLHLQGILSNAVVYPWWESAAMLAANQRSILLIPIALLLLLPLGWVVYGVLWLWRGLKAGGYGVYLAADRLNERRKTKKFLDAMAQRRREKERMILCEDNDLEETSLSDPGAVDDHFDSDSL